MSWFRMLPGSWLEIAALNVAAAGVAVALNSGSAGPSSCVSWSSEAKMDAYGYDHFVNLESKCPAQVSCAITTSTNPQSTTVTLAAGEQKRVLIWRGSPARELTAQVTCTAK